MPFATKYTSRSRNRVPLSLGVVAVAVCATSTGAQSAAPQPARATPQPDVWIAPLTMRGAAVSLGKPTNITSRPGYDNQPSFSPDGASLFYTSTREDAQADIYRYDVAASRTTRVTTTSPESEYSATVMPAGDAISVIRVERDSTQRLWRVPLDGSRSTVILERVKPVGYHAWADDHTLALFVLGTPATLQLADARTGASEVVDSDIGRSLHRIPGSHDISFVSRTHADRPWIMALNVATKAKRPLAPLPKGTEDYAWLPDGRIIAGDGAALVILDPRAAAGSDAGWRRIADFTNEGVSAISRLAVSPKGDRIAFVALPKAP